MKTADLSKLEMMEAWYKNDSSMRVTVNFPFFAATGNKSSSVVYFEIEPGRYLGTHTDSAEEIVLILRGTVEAHVGEEKGQLTGGQAALIPAMAPHGIRVNAVCPGFVRTPLVDKQIPEQAKELGISEEDVIKHVMLKDTVDGQFTTTEDVAEAVLFFAGFKTNALTGQSLIVSHGWSME